MNTGIGDAVNLAWKLAAVLQGRIGERALETYEPERIAFARALVRTTDRAFEFVSARGRIATRVRLSVAPFALPLFFRFRSIRTFFFRTLSQTEIRYPQSALSEGKTGRVSAGDRLPWISLGPALAEDNFAPLASRDWQLHVYGNISEPLRGFCASKGLAVHIFPWQASMRKAGLRQNATFLVRPDGYVGLADATARVPTLEHYLSEHQIVSSATVR